MGGSGVAPRAADPLDEAGKKILGDLGRRAIDEPRTDLRQLAADLGRGAVVDARAGALRDSATRASPRAKPAAPPCPSKVIRYEVGATRSASTMRPLNFADTGPTRAVIATWNSVSDTRSIDSQPGMQALSVLRIVERRPRRLDRRRHRARTRQLHQRPVASGCAARAVECRPARAAPRRLPPRERRRQLLQALQIVHRQKLIDVRQHRADPGRPRLELIVAQQRIEPDQAPTGFGQAFHLPAPARRRRRCRARR